MSTKTDIQSLQDLVVSALEDVKGKDIVVFDTEHLSALFERVIIVSGSSNRQTKALASSVRDEVRDAGLPKPRVEGEDNGEWIIVDCGAAVVHVMQPIIREYYRLEEIWGDKPVRIKQAKARGLVKASEPMDQDKAAPKKAAAKKPAASKSAPAKPVPAKKAAAKKTPAKPVAGKKVAAKKLPANTSKPKTVTVNKPKAAAKKVVKPAVKIPTKRVAVKAAAKPAAKTTAKPAAKKPSAKPAAKPVAKSAAKPAVKTAVKKPALKKPAAKKTK